MKKTLLNAQKSVKVKTIKPKVFATLAKGKVNQQILVPDINTIDMIVLGQFKSYHHDIKKLRESLYKRFFGIDYEVILETLGSQQKISVEHESDLKANVIANLQKTEATLDKLKKMAANFDLSFYSQDHSNSLNEVFVKQFEKIKNEYATKNIEWNSVCTQTIDALRQCEPTINKIHTLDSELVQLEKEFKPAIDSIFDPKMVVKPLPLHLDAKGEYTKLRTNIRKATINTPEKRKAYDDIRSVFNYAEDIAHDLEIWENIAEGKSENEKIILTEEGDISARKNVELDSFTRIIFKDTAKSEFSFPPADTFTEFEEKHNRFVQIVKTAKTNAIRCGDVTNFVEKMLMVNNQINGAKLIDITKETAQKFTDIEKKADKCSEEYTTDIMEEHSDILTDNFKKLQSKLNEAGAFLKESLGEITKVVVEPYRNGYNTLTKTVLDVLAEISTITPVEKDLFHAFEIAFGEAFGNAKRIAKRKRRLTIVDITPKVLKVERLENIIQNKLEDFSEQQPIYKTTMTIKNLVDEYGHIFDSVNDLLNDISTFEFVKVSTDKIYPDLVSYEFINIRRQDLLQIRELSSRIETFLVNLETIADKPGLTSHDKTVHPESKLIDELHEKQKKINVDLVRRNIQRLQAPFLLIRGAMLEIKTSPNDARLQRFELANKNLKEQLDMIAASYSDLLPIIDHITELIDAAIEKTTPLADVPEDNKQKFQKDSSPKTIPIPKQRQESVGESSSIPIGRPRV